MTYRITVLVSKHQTRPLESIEKHGLILRPHNGDIERQIVFRKSHETSTLP